MTEPLLEIEGLTRRFGGLVAVNALTMTVGESEIVGLIGPNGSGKTTALNLLSGALKPATTDSGTLPGCHGAPPRRFCQASAWVPEQKLGGGFRRGESASPNGESSTGRTHNVCTPVPIEAQSAIPGCDITGSNSRWCTPKMQLAI